MSHDCQAHCPRFQEALRRGACRWIVVTVLAFLLVLPESCPSVHAQTRTAPADTLTLTTAVEQALQSGARTRQAAAGRDAARAKADWRTSTYLPRAAATASTTQSRYPLTITPIREPGVFPRLDDTIHDLRVNASWTVFDFGRGRAERRAAQAIAHAAGVQYDLARMETIEAVTGAFVHLARLRAVEAAQQQRLDALRTQKSQLQTLRGEGRVAEVDLLKIKEVVLDAQANLRATQRQQENVLRMLAAEMGRRSSPSMDEIQLASLPPAEQQPPVPIDASVEQSPRVAAANARLSAAEANGRKATRAFLPSLEVFGTEQMRSGSTWEVDRQWRAGLRLEIPITPFRRSARRDAQQAKIREQEAALTDARRQVRVALDELANQLQDAADRAATAAARVKHLSEAYRIESAAHAEGRLTLTDLLTTEAKLAAARSERATARARLVQTRLQRSVLTGRLTLDRALQLIRQSP